MMFGNLLAVSVAASISLAGILAPSSQNVANEGLKGQATQVTSASKILGERVSPSTQIIRGDGLSLTVEDNPLTRASSVNTYAKAAKPDISCDLAVHDPHGSHHVNGNINVVAKIQCVGGKAARLKLAASLIRRTPNTRIWISPTYTKENKAYITANKAVLCKQGPGNFRGWGWGRITAPKGYEMKGPAEYQKYGHTKHVKCEAASKSSAKASISEKITVTFTPISN